jgi:phosphonate transport system substrate-binding protein
MNTKPFQCCFLIFAIALLLSGINSGCRQKGKTYEPTYLADSSAKKKLVFIVPTQTFYETADLFVKYLNDHLTGIQIQTVAGSSFMDYVDQVSKGKFDLTITSGNNALGCIRNGYTIIGRVVELYGYSGAIIVNRDSAINDLSDLKGRTIATPGVPALGGHMLQMLYLVKNGFDIRREIKIRKVESFESVIMNVYLGKCAAGFIHKTALYTILDRRPELKSKVSVLLNTPEMVNNPILIRSGLETEIGDQLRQVLFSMHSSEDGRKALAKLGYLRMLPADSNSYQPLKSFLKEYSALVGDQ